MISLTWVGLALALAAMLLAQVRQAPPVGAANAGLCFPLVAHPLIWTLFIRE